MHSVLIEVPALAEFTYCVFPELHSCKVHTGHDNVIKWHHSQCFPHIHFTWASPPNMFGNPFCHFISLVYFLISEGEQCHQWSVNLWTVFSRSSPPSPHMRKSFSLVLLSFCKCTDCDASTPILCRPTYAIVLYQFGSAPGCVMSCPISESEDTNNTWHFGLAFIWRFWWWLMILIAL